MGGFCFWGIAHASPTSRRKLSPLTRVLRPILNVSSDPELISSWSFVVPMQSVSHASRREKASLAVICYLLIVRDRLRER